MQSAYSGIWVCYLVINFVNNKASLKAFKSLQSNSEWGLWERLAEIIINASTVSERRAVEECQLVISSFVFAVFTLFVCVARLEFKNQSAGYNGRILIMTEGASSVFHSCIIHTNGWTNKSPTKHANPKIRAQLRTTRRSRQNLPCPTGAKARLKFWAVAEV